MFEMLEGRRLRSATVTETYPGFFEIVGTDEADEIVISVSMGDETFTLDGTTYTGVSGFWLQTGEGDDDITVTSVDGQGAIGAAITAGHGNNRVSLNFDGAITTGDGDDYISLADSFRGEVRANGGNDQVFLSAFCQDAVVWGGDGDDTIDCTANLLGVLVYGGAGDDLIIGSPYADSLYGDGGNDSIYGGGGSDYLYGGGGTDFADGGAGNDFFFMGSGWTVVGGSGNDSIYAYDLGGSSSEVEHIHQQV